MDDQSIKARAEACYKLNLNLHQIFDDTTAEMLNNIACAFAINAEFLMKEILPFM